MRRLHRFLAARAHLRAALLSIRLGRAYLDRDDFYRKDDIAAAEELLEDLIAGLDREIGVLVYGSPQEVYSESARRVLEKVIFAR